MREMTLTDLDRLSAATVEVEKTLEMDEDAFRVFYDRTARPLWAYLSRIVGPAHPVEDLLQETYYRFLRSGAVHESDDHRRRYLFRIATNLAHDAYRRRRPAVDPAQMNRATDPGDPGSAGEADRAARRVDLSRALAKLKPRQRELLWLAYAQGSSHEEIAQILGLKTGSIKLLLFRARRRLALLLGEPNKVGQ